MAQITWGDGEGAGKVHFNGHVSLSGCVLENAGGPGEGVVLAYNVHAVDVDAVLGIPGTEGVGNALDTVGEHIIIPNSWAGDGNGWIGNDAIHYNWTGWGGIVPQIDVTQNLTLEMWVYRAAFAEYDMDPYFYLGRADYDRVIIGEYTPTPTGRIFSCLRASNPPGTQVRDITETALLLNGEWQHFSLERHGNNLHTYINGTRVATTDTSGVSAYTYQDRWRGSGSVAEGRRWNDIYLTQRALHEGAGFSPARYKSAAQNSGIQPYVELSNTGLSGQIPSSISWNAQTGASYGQIKAVYILDAALGWTAVGGAYPTSPITVSGLTLGADSCLRFVLEPTSGIQAGTPTLRDASLEYNAPSTAITEAAPWTIGATATLTVRDVSGEQFASNGRRAQSYLPSIGRLAQEFFASGGRRAQDYLPTKGGRG